MNFRNAVHVYKRNEKKTTRSNTIYMYHCNFFCNGIFSIKYKNNRHFRWEFKTEDHDIGFGVFYQSLKGNVPVVETSRVNSHVVAEDGSCVCEEPGICKLRIRCTFYSQRAHFSRAILPTTLDLLDRGQSSETSSDSTVDKSHRPFLMATIIESYSVKKIMLFGNM